MGSPNRISVESLLHSFHNLNLNYASASAASSASADLWRLICGNDYPYLIPTKSKIIINAALTPLGSQTIQQILSLNIPEDIKTIFEAAIHSIFDLMINKAGHHVFGNLIPVLNNQQLYQIAATLAMCPSALVKVCINNFGSPSIKRFIKKIARFDVAAGVLVDALCIGFNDLMVHKTGCHVILQCLESFNYFHTHLLYKEAMKVENINFLGTNVTGCLALNSFIAASRGQGRNDLLAWISNHSVYLAQDPYGNFVIQCLLGLDHPVLTQKICYLLKGHYVNMSMLKGNSHVVEKCLKSCAKAYAVVELLECTEGLLLQVAKDPYGNYVIQTALKETRRHPKLGSCYYGLVARIRPQIHNLQRGVGRNVSNLIYKFDAEDRLMYGVMN